MSASKTVANASFASFSEYFSGKRVVITGAGSGIGFAAMQAFIDTGANVVAHLGRGDAREIEIPDSVQTIHCDLITESGQDDFVEHVRSCTDAVDVLINNAGTMFGRFAADELTDNQYSDIIGLNQTAVVRITRGLIPLLRRSDAAAIINTVSISASTGGSPGSAIYSASKAFVSTYTKAIARELAPDNIRANAISPGVIATDFHKRYSSAEKLEKTRTQIPLQRLGTPADCAPAFLFLGSDILSGYITGQVLEINGGQY